MENCGEPVLECHGQDKDHLGGLGGRPEGPWSANGKNPKRGALYGKLDRNAGHCIVQRLKREGLHKENGKCDFCPDRVDDEVNFLFE